MSDATQLEGRYRRLLAFYPQAFRREREQEMLSVLIAGAAEGQRRPSLDEAIDLLRSAIFMRLWQMFEKLFVRPYEVRHRRLLWGFRIVWGLVLLGVAMVALSYGSWWAVWFLAGAAADFVFGYRIYQIAQRQPPT
ncbi:MAG: hypothetical protein ACLQBX_06920 [Candidatus Limnocylindrales bacterium]